MAYLFEPRNSSFEITIDSFNNLLNFWKGDGNQQKVYENKTQYLKGSDCIDSYFDAVIALCVFSDCSLSTLWMPFECLLTANLFLTDCLNIWAWIMKIDCSRQTWTAQMDGQINKRTNIVTAWAPVGAKNSLSYDQIITRIKCLQLMKMSLVKQA